MSNNTNTNQNVIEFIFTAISDNQNTIRSIDTKFGFILVILSIPFSNFSKIYSKTSALFLNNYDFTLFFIELLIVVFFLSWTFAFISALRGISSIDNPIIHISNPEHKTKGLFYLGGQNNLNILDSIFNRKSIMSTIDHKTLIDNYKEDSFNILQELTIEQLKINYIRDIKIIRQKWSYIFLLVWLFSGAILYLVSKIAI